MNRYDAERIAKAFLVCIEPAISRGHIAGSIRRKEPTVNDAEIVVAARTAPALALFDTGERRSLLEPRLEQLAAQGYCQLDQVTKRNGPRYKRFIKSGLHIDLFIVAPPAEFGAILAVRTGPAAFSKWLVTEYQYGGAMPIGCTLEGGALHRYGKIVPTPTEEDFFREIGQRWIAPEYRMHYAPYTKDARGLRVHG